MDYEQIDRLATIRASYALSVKGEHVTLLEAAAGLDVCAPRSEDELRALLAVCTTWDVALNIDDEIWRN